MYRQPVGIEKGLPGEYLLDLLFEVGPSQWAGDVEGAVSPERLTAYLTGTWGEWQAWEYRAVLAMSRAYVRGKVEGKDVHCIAPVDREEET